MLAFIGRCSPAWDRDALVLAGLLSALLHLVLLLNWLILHRQAPAQNPRSPETEVALVSPPTVDAGEASAAGGAPASRAAAPELQARLPAPGAPSAAKPPEGRIGDWAQSRSVLSSLALADPRNRKAAESLKHLEQETRLQQLCDFEAILQINRQYGQYAVDFVIAYATGATIRRGDAIVANGAAFHSNGRWYNLAFECQLSANQRDVARLKFKLGDAIPEERWADLNLPKAPANPLGGD